MPDVCPGSDVPVTASAPEVAPDTSPNPAPAPEPSLFTGALPMRQALGQLRQRLLDPTGRNQLINFRATPGRALPLVHSSIEGTFRRLQSDAASKVTLAPLPEPDRAEWVEKGGKLVRPEPLAYAARIGINPAPELLRGGRNELAAPDSGSTLRTLFYAEDLARHCRKLDREARLALEETGANMLYLVLGFLDYPESPGSDKIYRAPLLCLPVTLTQTQTGLYPSFQISATGDELADNLSLRDKVLRDFGLTLPSYDTDSDTAIEDYFDQVADAVAALPQWKVRRMMTLALLSFSNMLLVRDLDPESWTQADGSSALLAHPLIRQVFEGRAARDTAPDLIAEATSDASDDASAEYAIDDHPGGDLPLIYDADSSQHSALIDVLAGHSRVIEGPPGTGKSQTITNLIAAALQAGKTVLFVAEKLAALEVVQSRLAHVGLAPFVLELHSNKVSKRRVLDDLDVRLKLPRPERGPLPELLAQQAAKRATLKSYMEWMNTRLPEPVALTLHQVMWRAERRRLRCGPCASEVQHLRVPTAAQTSATQMAATSDRLRYLAEHIGPIGQYGPEHPLWGFFPAEFRPEDDLPVQRTLTDFAARFANFAQATQQLGALLGVQAERGYSLPEAAAGKLLAQLADLAPADALNFALMPALFPADDAHGQRALAVLQDVQERIDQLNDTDIQLARLLISPAAPISVDVAAAAIDAHSALHHLGLAARQRSELQADAAALRQASAAAHAALAQLQTLAGQVNQIAACALPWEGSAADIARLLALGRCLAAAPVALLALRHDGLRAPGSAATLRHARHTAAQLQAQQARLQERLYTDLLPTEAELTTAILTLREGETWFRVFQGPWRQALQLHRRLDRHKTPLTPAQRLVDLELLLQHQAAQRAWQADADVRRAAGEHLKAEATPFEELAVCADWLTHSAQALEAADLPPLQLDLLKLERPALLRLMQLAPALAAAGESLADFEAAARTVLAHAAAPARQSLLTGVWPQRLAAAQAVEATLTTALHWMQTHVRPEVSADAGLAAIGQRHELPALEAELDQHAAASALLGAHFAGRRTPLDTALSTHAHGLRIASANLPAPIKNALCSADGADKHHRLVAAISAIRQGWQDAPAFAQAMAHYGQFEAALWANSAQPSTPAYAQALAQRTRRAADSLGGLLPWTQYVGARASVVNLGLEAFVLLLEAGTVPPAQLVDAFGYRFYASVAHSVFDANPALRQFSGLRHSAIRAEFAQLDRDIIQLRGQQIVGDCLARSEPPSGKHGARVDDKTELKLLEHLIPQQRPRVSVRQMLKRAGAAIQALKPCFMMGPQAVAQFLEPGQLHFDIVVMDEASQLRPEQAIGAIARGTQLVVVGDPKQLPPTSFFARADAEPDADSPALATNDAESILEVCISHFQPVRTLRWHYRSRHESLIAFSNQHFYQSKLVLFPSPFAKSDTLGLRYHYIADGVYEGQTNLIEAERVVDAVVAHILHRPGDSLGIVTLNIKQRDVLDDMLDERLRLLPEAAAFKAHWDAEGRGLFVKNLENVQGDERDCIMISTTFGKPPGSSVVRQNFGPISRQGGWRRLNVLFTRARKSVAVYSSMRPQDIAVDASTPEGTRALRNYLEYADTAVLPVERETGLPPDSDFEIAVMEVLKTKGYEVTPQLGVAGFRIDLAVRYPGHLSGYLAAIECDGAAYHSGVSVRDRDRIRQEILESLGWRGRIWRIWSTDWFRNPQAETQRLVDFLEGLRTQAAARLVTEAD